MNSSDPLITDPGHTGKDLTHEVREPIPTQHVRRATFDVTTLPPAPTGWRRLAKRIDPPVQLARIALVVLLILLWQYAVEQEWINRIFTASPTQVWDGFTQIVRTRQFWDDLLVTMRERPRSGHSTLEPTSR